MKTETVSTRPSVRAQAAVLCSGLLTPLLVGCAGPSSVPDVGDEPVATKTSALVFAQLKFPLNQFPVEIKNAHSGKCLDIPGAATASNTNVQQFTCNGGTNQTFLVSPSGPTSYQIRTGHVGNVNLNIAGGSLADGASLNIHSEVPAHSQIFSFVQEADGNFSIVSNNSGKCLDVPGASTENHASIQQFGCHGGANQRWILTARPIAMHLIAKHSEKCVDVPGASTADVNMQQYTCAEGTHQRWSIGSTTTVGGISYFTLVANHSGKCLTVAGTADHASVHQLTCNGGDNQKWQMVESSDGYVALKNKNSGKCADIANASADNHAGIQQFPCHGGANQAFWWSIFENRHLQVVNVAPTAGTPGTRLTQSDDAVSQHVARVNAIYGRYGLRLTYDPATDKSEVNNDALYNLGACPSCVFTCPNGSVGKDAECADQYSLANFPGKVVVFSRPGSGFTAGNASYIALGKMGSDVIDPVCGSLPNTQWLAHEFGHYVGLSHTHNGDGDLLSDTRPDPNDDDCLAPNSPTGTAIAFDGSTVDVNNVLSYYYHESPLITPMQASLTRAAAFSRGY